MREQVRIKVLIRRPAKPGELISNFETLVNGFAPVEGLPRLGETLHLKVSDDHTVHYQVVKYTPYMTVTTAGNLNLDHIEIILGAS